MERSFQLDMTALTQLMPLGMVLDDRARVLAMGATVARLFGDVRAMGCNVFSLFEVKGPKGRVDAASVRQVVGQKLRLVRRQGEGALRLKGLLVPLAQPQGWILNLSFGIDLPRAVAQLQLTDGDFAPTDLAIELLYMVEANVAVTGELKALAERLDGARQQAREEALTDTLTGLRNRRACDSVLARLCREGAGFALMHMDLDFFKAVNDTLGHAAGDHVLIHVASVLKACARAQDCIARVGGDEFVILMPGNTDAMALALTAERVISQLTRPIPYQDQLCQISASFGYIVVPAGETPDPAQVLGDADTALYAAKHAGRGCAVRYRPGMGSDLPSPNLALGDR
jgi:diguanylate cyclase (GGDEF)-like protein